MRWLVAVMSIAATREKASLIGLAFLLAAAW